MCDTLRCEIVRDLMPNYIEDLTGHETNEMIVNHLQACEVCRELCDKLKAEMAVPKFEKRDLLRLLKAIRKAKVTQIAAAVLAGIVLTWVAILVMSSGLSVVSPDEIQLQNVYRMSDGSVLIVYTVPGLDNSMRAGISGSQAGNGDYAFEISTSFWNRLFGKAELEREVFYEQVYSIHPLNSAYDGSVQASIEPMIISYGFGRNARELWRRGDPLEEAPETLEMYLHRGGWNQGYETFLKDYLWRMSFSEVVSTAKPGESVN